MECASAGVSGSDMNGCAQRTRCGQMRHKARDERAGVSENRLSCGCGLAERRSRCECRNVYRARGCASTKGEVGLPALEGAQAVRCELHRRTFSGAFKMQVGMVVVEVKVQKAELRSSAVGKQQAPTGYACLRPDIAAYAHSHDRVPDQ